MSARNVATTYVPPLGRGLFKKGARRRLYVEYSGTAVARSPLENVTISVVILSDSPVNSKSVYFHQVVGYDLCTYFAGSLASFKNNS